LLAHRGSAVRLLVLTVAVAAGAAAAFGTLTIEVRRLLAPGRAWLLRLVAIRALIVLVRQALLSARLLEPAVLPLLLLATASGVGFIVRHLRFLAPGDDADPNARGPVASPCQARNGA
jgi:hypothetical protein